VPGTQQSADELPRRWQWTTLLVGVAYFVVGIVFGALGRGGSSDQARATWRLLAWAISAAAFAAHIGYEHFRQRSSPVRTALHVSLAVALGAFGIAVAANIHSSGSGSSHQSSLLRLALVAFPAVTAVPAFVVALVAAASLSRWRRDVAR
jgi:hypothetical protein